jgi:hypothetical protein
MFVPRNSCVHTKANTVSLPAHELTCASGQPGLKALDTQEQLSNVPSVLWESCNLAFLRRILYDFLNGLIHQPSHSCNKCLVHATLAYEAVST